MGSYDKYDNYRITTTEDMMEGMIDNMYDDEIDDEIRAFAKYARKLKVKDYSKLVVLIDSMGMFGYNETEVPYMSDERNGNVFYFFKNENDCHKFIDDYESSLEYEIESINDIVDIDNNAVNYSIYQMKNTDETAYLTFLSYNSLMRELQKRYGNNTHIEENMYNKVYSGTIERNGSFDTELLDELFYIFNTRKPKDFKGHSLSIGDIVTLDGKAFYVDDMGFQFLTDFFA